MYSNFLFHFNYSCITIFATLVFTEVITTSQHSNINRKKLGNNSLFILITLLSDNISLHCFYLQLLFVNIG